MAMEDDWWPDLMRDLAEEKPWAAPQVVVAELRSYDDPWSPGARTLWSALVAPTDLAALGGRLIGFDYHVDTSGPRPGTDAAGEYHPSFWISAINGDLRIKCEPLVLSWETNNRTAMVIDPRFTMTYGLIPRTQADGSIRWDNPAEPEFDVAIVDAPSIYDDSKHSGARVLISRDHLQDYLTLRGLELIQVYHEIRRGPRDDAIEAMLGDQDRLIENLRDREIDIQRRREGGFVAQVWGARHIAGPANLPITTDPLDMEGLVWPGIEGAITNEDARRFRPWNHVFVRDTVLAAYEGKPGFSVSSETGGVGFGNQWSIGFSARVGRDVIRLEVRKLYEGAPARAIQHWHDHAVTPTPELQADEARLARNIGVRSKELVYRIAGVGIRLGELADRLGTSGLDGRHFVGLDKPKLDYEGWWNGPEVEPTTRHIPLEMGRSDFLNRCLLLDKLLVEALAQKHLRPMVRAIGAPADKIDGFGGLKLLDRIVCLAQISLSSGLRLWESGDEIVARHHTEGTTPAHPLTKLFALSDLRQVAGHRKEDADRLIGEALDRFGLNLAATAGGWGTTLDQIYDQLSNQLQEIEATLLAAMRV